MDKNALLCASKEPKSQPNFSAIYSFVMYAISDFSEAIIGALLIFGLIMFMYLSPIIEKRPPWGLPFFDSLPFTIIQSDPEIYVSAGITTSSCS